MKLLIVHIPFLPADGMALFPFIFIKQRSYKKHKSLINHEKIHLIQQLELLIILFYVFYFLNYLLNLIRYRSHYTAYMNIAFEREAYHMERNPDYLKKRRFWTWMKYL